MKLSGQYSKVLVYLSLLPLLFALFLALFQYFGGTSFWGHDMSFARINSYIYAHSYAALMLALMAGLQIGLLISAKDLIGYVFFYLLLLIMVWLSFQSYADFLGLTFLTVCWSMAWVIELKLQNHIPQTVWFKQAKLHAYVMTLLILLILLLVNG